MAVIVNGNKIYVGALLGDRYFSVDRTKIRQTVRYSKGGMGERRCVRDFRATKTISLDSVRSLEYLYVTIFEK